MQTAGWTVLCCAVLCWPCKLVAVLCCPVLCWPCKLQDSYLCEEFRCPWVTAGRCSLQAKKHDQHTHAVGQHACSAVLACSTCVHRVHSACRPAHTVLCMLCCKLLVPRTTSTVSAGMVSVQRVQSCCCCRLTLYRVIRIAHEPWPGAGVCTPHFCRGPRCAACCSSRGVGGSASSGNSPLQTLMMMPNMVGVMSLTLQDQTSISSQCAGTAVAYARACCCCCCCRATAAEGEMLLCQ